MPIQPSVFTDELSPEFAAAVEMAAGAGARGVELRNHLLGHPLAGLTVEAAGRIGEIVAGAGLEVAALASPIGKCAHDDLSAQEGHAALLERLGALAPLIGTKRVRVFALWRPDRGSTPHSDRPDLDRFLPAITRFMKMLAPIARQKDLELCLEMEGATLIGTCSEAGRVIEAVGSAANLGVTWDLNNSAWCGEAPLDTGYNAIRGLVRHLHIKPDASGGLRRTPDGSTSHREILETLMRDGYQGWATVEHWGEPPATIDGVRQLVELLNEIQATDQAPSPPPLR